MKNRLRADTASAPVPSWQQGGSKRCYSSPSMWLRESMQAPIGPAFLPSLENFITVPLLTMLRECLLMALLIGSMRYSSATESRPPTTTRSGLKMFISPAIARPSVLPTSSSVSMVSTSSSVRAPSMSSRVISSPAENFDDRIEALPSLSLSMRSLCRARPEAPVSRQPTLPHWQMMSLSSRGKCPISPENPDFP